MRVVWAFDKDLKIGRYIDNGVFLDGRSETLNKFDGGNKTLEESGVVHGKEEFTKPKKRRNIESDKVERLKKSAKGTRSIKSWFLN